MQRILHSFFLFFFQGYNYNNLISFREAEVVLLALKETSKVVALVSFSKLLVHVCFKIG